MKKRSALIQDIWMEIRRSRGRFLSILCIVMLGAGLPGYETDGSAIF